MGHAPLEDSLWYATAAPAPATHPIDGQVQADVCVVGAGYTGLSTALHLAEKGVNVAVLEAQQAGFGGSGRNAGHCTPTFHYYSIPKVRQMLGETFGPRIIERQTNGTNIAFDIIRRYGIDCEGVQTGYVQPAHAPSMLKKLEAKCRTYQEVGKAARMLDRAETERLTGSPRYFGAWFHPEGGHLNPLGYSRGLARAAMSQGARIFTDSPVTAIKPEGSRWRVETPSGSVVADKVVCGTGAYTSDFWPGLRQTFTILTVACLATEPLSDNLRKSIAPENNTVVESRSDPAIYKFDKDGRLVTSVFVEGRRGGDPAHTKTMVEARLKWILPQLGDVTWQYYWYGDLDMQPRTIPRLYDLAPGVIASLGYSGRGVPTGTMMGTVLADWAMGVPAKDLALPLEPLKPVPFYMHVAPRALLPYYRFRDQRIARRDGVRPPPY
ncbi:MAG: FAD-binding oxidoreductase [Rhodospirillaceae bacterium]|nr:FAD-binding oxidoreductase [Rhodospirillaceae bacterium]